MGECIQELIDRAKTAYDAMNPSQRARHDYEQRRSFVRGMCPFDYDYAEWSKVVDRVLPPMDAPATKAEGDGR